jgi:hypothetical protein
LGPEKSMDTTEKGVLPREENKDATRRSTEKTQGLPDQKNHGTAVDVENCLPGECKFPQSTNSEILQTMVYQWLILAICRCRTGQPFRR